MANLSKYAKQRIISLKESGLTNREVVEALKHEGTTEIRVTTQVVRRCHKRYLQTGSIERRKGSGRPTLRTSALLNTIEDIMHADDEATAIQIRSYLLLHGHRLLSLSTILRGRRELGWTYRGSAYCQLIRGHTYFGIKWQILPLCLKGKFYANHAFVHKGKILRQGCHCVHNDSILRH